MDEAFFFADAADSPSGDARAAEDLCIPFVRVLGASGAAVSTLGDPFGTQTICASEGWAARFDEIQIDLGEGPCWEALRSSRPVLESDVQHANPGTWPIALQALKEAGLGAVCALPLLVGSIKVGSVALYFTRPHDFTDLQVSDAQALAAIAARRVLRRALLTAERLGDDPGEEGPYSRREVHQATGMILAQMRITADDARLVLQGHAFTTGRTVRETAADVIGRRLDFSFNLDSDPKG